MGFEPADTGAIDSIIDEVIAANPDKVAEIQGGNEKLLNFLTGQVMKASKGKANPKIVTDGLKEKIFQNVAKAPKTKKKYGCLKAILKACSVVMKFQSFLSHRRDGLGSERLLRLRIRTDSSSILIKDC